MVSERRHFVAESLAASVYRLDSVLNPWGFTFTSEGVEGSHTGPYASGHYCRDTTRIGISCRESIDNIYYQHSFMTQHLSFREIERYTIGHDTLMRALDHSEDCNLVAGNRQPDVVVAREGEDRVGALIHDLSYFAVQVLREPNARFYEIMRSGQRAYDVDY